MCLAVAAAANAAPDPNWCSWLFHNSFFLVAAPDFVAKESIPHPEHRKRFKGMTPIFLGIHNTSLIYYILARFASAYLLNLCYPAAPKHRHRHRFKEKH